MPRTLVNSDLFPPIGPYSHAVKAGGQVFVAATPGVDPATGQLAGPDAYTQTRQTLKNIAAMLASADASLQDVVHMQVNLVDVADFAEMNRAYAEFFTEPYPARSVIGVAALPKPGAVLTINAIAVLGGS
ncbi:RidA family protein [Pseudoduganella sp. OTU4001]|uniref:RidA family protein n=1 Tax=Pseudoduganella sp. OTU4001 TaxID=3043854 RepID=UPI00313CED9A